jgi:Flp pilus assembly protein TadD
MFQGLIDDKHDGYDARLGLGKIAADEGDLPEAQKQLALAKKYDPDSAEPYVLLAKALGKTQPDAAAAELEAAAKLEVMDSSIPKALVEIYTKKQAWADVVRTARLSQMIDPYDVEVHGAMARALLALGRKDEARVELELRKQSAAIRGAPPPPSPR